MGRAALTGQGGSASRQHGGEEVLVSLKLLGLQWPSLCVISHLDLKGHMQALGLVRAAWVLLLLGLQHWPDPLPPPLDQCHAVTDGLGHNLHIALMEETRINLQRKSPIIIGTSPSTYPTAGPVRPPVPPSPKLWSLCPKSPPQGPSPPSFKDTLVIP